MVMDRFTIENEGTYTVQINDGKAKNQSSLVLIGDGMRSRMPSRAHKTKFKENPCGQTEANICHFFFLLKY